ncbi:MAG: hypothetical protein M1822_009001 [Bathelium mastoideum]|nr:MAG: hypothetical protein M1822_009001 [Bathelium mastoideum]
MKRSDQERKKIATILHALTAVPLVSIGLRIQFRSQGTLRAPALHALPPPLDYEPQKPCNTLPSNTRVPIQQGIVLNDPPQTGVSASHAEQSLPSTSPADTQAHTGRNDCLERTPAEPSSRSSLEDVWSDEIGAKQTNSSDEASTKSSSGPRDRFFDVKGCLKWFSQNGLTYALALTTLIMTAVALWPATDAKDEGDLANALSVWTAKKDFIEFCADQVS